MFQWLSLSHLIGCYARQETCSYLLSVVPGYFSMYGVFRTEFGRDFLRTRPWRAVRCRHLDLGAASFARSLATTNKHGASPTKKCSARANKLGKPAAPRNFWPGSCLRQAQVLANQTRVSSKLLKLHDIERTPRTSPGDFTTNCLSSRRGNFRSDIESAETSPSQAAIALIMASSYSSPFAALQNNPVFSGLSDVYNAFQERRAKLGLSNPGKVEDISKGM